MAIPEWAEALPAEQKQYIMDLNSQVSTLADKQSRAVILPPSGATPEQQADFERKMGEQGYIRNDVPKAPDGYDVKVELDGIPNGEAWKQGILARCHEAGMTKKQAAKVVEREAGALRAAAADLTREYGENADAAIKALARAQEKYGINAGDPVASTKATLKALIDIGMTMEPDNTRVTGPTTIPKDSLPTLRARERELTEKLSKLPGYDERSVPLMQDIGEVALRIHAAETGQPITPELIAEARNVSLPGT